MLSHSWSGNIRELRNRIKRAIIVAQEDLLSVEDLGFDKNMVKSTNQENAAMIVKLKDEEREIEQIKLALGESSNNITRAAKLLGISRQSLHAKLRRYKLR